MKSMTQCFVFVFSLLLALRLLGEDKSAKPPVYELVVFHAVWCQPCQRMKPNLYDQDTRNKIGALGIVATRHVDIEKHPDIYRSFRFEVVPAMAVIDVSDSKKSVIVKRDTGYQSKNDIVKFVEKAVKKNRD